MKQCHILALKTWPDPVKTLELDFLSTVQLPSMPANDKLF